MISFERKGEEPLPPEKGLPQKPPQMPEDDWKLVKKDRRVKSVPWPKGDDWREPPEQPLPPPDGTKH